MEPPFWGPILFASTLISGLNCSVFKSMKLSDNNKTISNDSKQSEVTTSNSISKHGSFIVRNQIKFLTPAKRLLSGLISKETFSAWIHFFGLYAWLLWFWANVNERRHPTSICSADIWLFVSMKLEKRLSFELLDSVLFSDLCHLF